MQTKLGRVVFGKRVRIQHVRLFETRNLRVSAARFIERALLSDCVCRIKFCGCAFFSPAPAGFGSLDWPLSFKPLAK